MNGIEVTSKLFLHTHKVRCWLYISKSK